MSRLSQHRLEVEHMDPSREDSVRRVLRGFRPDVIFHLSGLSRPERALADPAGAFEANTRSVWVLLEAIRLLAPASAFIFVSSADLFKRRCDLAHPYFASKLAAESIAAGYATSYGLRVAIARLSNVYGPADDVDRLVTAVIAAALTRVELRLKHPRRRFDLLYVTDATDGLLAVSENLIAAKPQIFSLTTGTTVAGAHVGRLVERLVEGERVAVSRRPAKSRRPSEARPPGWWPRVSLLAGLAATIDWHREQSREILDA